MEEGVRGGVSLSLTNICSGNSVHHMVSTDMIGSVAFITGLWWKPWLSTRLPWNLLPKGVEGQPHTSRWGWKSNSPSVFYKHYKTEMEFHYLPKEMKTLASFISFSDTTLILLKDSWECKSIYPSWLWLAWVIVCPQVFLCCLTRLKQLLFKSFLY